MFMPDWTAKDDPKKFLIQSEKHIHEIAERYKNTIPIWDVTNEELARIIRPEEWHKLPINYLSWCFERCKYRIS
jgi:GH35 family endo-1,4-beta-xylanase